MTLNNFIGNVIGKPWAKYACGPNEYDCWGLVEAYYKQVRSIDVSVSGFHEKSIDIDEGYFSEVAANRWVQVEYPNSEDIVFMAFKNDMPCHVGIVIGDKCLHSNGNDKKPGQVMLTKLHVMRRLYKDMSFYRFNA